MSFSVKLFANCPGGFVTKRDPEIIPIAPFPGLVIGSLTVKNVLVAQGPFKNDDIECEMEEVDQEQRDILIDQHAWIFEGIDDDSDNCDVLSIPIEENDYGDKTIGEYLNSVFDKIWVHKICSALIRSGHIKGEVNEYHGFCKVKKEDQSKAKTMIFEAISRAFEPWVENETRD
jgi:hypothetical protein